VDVRRQEAGSKHSNSTLGMAKHIVAKDGVKGLYRGFGASLMTITPSSALWWGAYGFYSQQIWRALGEEDVVSRGGGGAADVGPSTGTVAGVQIAGGLCAGITSGFLTNPLDVLKTRLQVR
jgi:solute carrier family 25 protein 44